ncbi:Eco57I restriction-modification methylase domain-containing protein [Zunongwangia endophytica]|uniref:site-specific DNA-methyltransferase (adenine-specific) n=1 Tax=Zunongwangia endophytica TaxID=1808945 RepID=A0ABV8H801_9FLAO|nr:N-6 DNA methylase [Zunongwangia endophytica]MDN3595126.1 N-6 DNA methylase [Zunongwangia endophytica]
MALFQTSVLKKHLKAQDNLVISKAYKTFSRYFLDSKIQENIKSSKEEEYQGIFLTELFVNILGYTMKPNTNYNLVAEYKNQTNSRKADGAILKDEVALGVIELKGTNTKHLEGIRQQAFDYKANQKGCVYVITSNFEKLRFYINDATEFLEFNLFQLTQDQFALLYLCLQQDNLISGLPLKIKEASLVEEEQITKGFYKDYSIFKRELYRDLVRNNAKKLKNLRHSELVSETQQSDNEALQTEFDRLEKNVKLTLFKKSQKLIDRFLFIFFAEDRGLLPPNAILQIIEDWHQLKDLDVNQPLYERFKLYFKYLDTGRKGTDKKAEIFAYNGGLFKPDALLNLLEINDELLAKHTAKLSKYDFESQVDVNILGHIFENSLNEIESVNAEIEGDNFDKQKSKRKKDGVFYTPKYITKYIVENTVGKLCEEKKTELEFREEEYFEVKKGTHIATKKKLLATLDTYRDWLLQLTICDPACGSGAFLNQALEFLIAEHTYIDELKAKVLGGAIVFSDIENTILENNIYGVDINEESVEIAKLSLWLRTAQPRRKLNDLSNSIKCGNSLIDAKSVAGDKAFKWETEFPEVFAKGGFDVVIGNPPYGAEFNETNKKFIQKSYISYQYKFESYLYFYEKGITILKNSGLLSFITPELFLRLDKSLNIRKYLLNHSIPLEFKFCGEKVFEDVNVNSVIATFRKEDSTKNKYFKIIPLNQPKWYYEISRWKSEPLLIIDYQVSPLTIKITEKIFNKSKKLGSYGEAIQGLTPYDSYKGQSKEIIKSRAFHHPNKIDDSCGIWLDGKNIGRYYYVTGTEWLQYGDWLASPREPRFFEGARLLFREVPGSGRRIQCTYLEDRFYYGHSITPFKLDEKLDKNILYKLLAIVNSKMISWFASVKVSNFAKKTFPKLNPKDIKSLPISEEINLSKSNNLQIAAIEIIEKNKKIKVVVNKFQNYLLSQFPIEKLTKKLQNWHELDFGEFIKELNKAITKENRERRKNEQEEIPKLTKKAEFEWMELFEDNKKKAVELQTQINQLDHQIDQMVYELYGLTDEEIKIVEQS